MSADRTRLDSHELFHITTCPYCIKVRLALDALHLDVALKDIFTHPEYESELIQGGGKSQVPCLRIQHATGGVEWLYESDDIVRYLDKARDAIR